MAEILKINDLTYEIENKTFFKNFNLTVEKNKITSIIAPNKSGKTMLTKIISAIIPTDNLITLEDITLNKKSVLNYIAKIGIVTNDFNNQFLFKKVKEELAFPLTNLGYSEKNINKAITKASEYFEIENLLNKNIDTLTLDEKSKLTIVLALIHEPKLLILDDAFLNLLPDTKVFMLNKLKDLNKHGLTILNITSDLETTFFSDRILVLNNFTIEMEGTKEEIYESDSYLRKIGITIPFIIDLSLKLKFYNLIDKIYYSLENLEEDLWK